MPRKKVDWRVKNDTWHLGERTLLAAVLNITPDSIADAGHYMDPDRAFVRAMELADQGADILELGAESIRQGSARVADTVEIQRLVPVLKRLRGKLAIPIAVETSKPQVADRVLSLGVAIIKDPSGLTLDPQLAKVVAQHDAGFVLQHMRGTPEAWARMGSFADPLGTVFRELDAAVSRAVRSGILRQRIAIDPGLGLGKRKEQNSEILAGLDLFGKLAVPIQVSPTGKLFAADFPTDPGLSGVIAASTAAILKGAHILRVHDIPAIRPAALVADQLLRRG